MALSRRQLLIHGGRLAVASAAGLWSLDRVAGAAGLSPDAPEGLRSASRSADRAVSGRHGHPDDYRLWGNREYIRDASGTRWVKLWVSWYDVQQELGFPPVGRENSWRHLNGAPGGLGWLRRLDGQVRAINDDRLGVLLCIDHTYPTWSSGAAGSDPPTRASPPPKLPLDVSPDGPWGWFVSHLLARYRKGARPNPIGPTGGLLEIAHGYDRSSAIRTAPDRRPRDLQRAQRLSRLAQEGAVERRPDDPVRDAALGSLRGPDPRSGDLRLPGRDDDERGRRVRDGRSDFTLGVLSALSGYRSPVPLRWSRHYPGCAGSERPARRRSWRCSTAPLDERRSHRSGC